MVARAPYEALDRLRQMAASGELGALCERFDLDLLVVHGSTLDPGAGAGDLDLALWPRRGGGFDLLQVYTELPSLLAIDDIDVMDLSRAGVVARGLALGICEPLYERVEGLFARRQMAALPALADTCWIRDLGLRVMAGQA